MPRRRDAALLLLLLLLLGPLPGSAAPQSADAAPGPDRSAIDRRLEFEKSTPQQTFIIPYRATYILPLTYNSRPNNQPYDPALRQDLDKQEMKFQISFKVPVAKGVLFGHGDLDFGYTQLSFWQAYSSAYSSPFRETDHEPELMLTFPAHWHLFGLHGRLARLSLNHQSNGRGGPVSRSWNRVVVEALFERDNLYLDFRPWWRIPEAQAKDDNPDIGKYLGNFELHLLQERDSQSYGLMLRNNLRAENRGAIQLDWTFPLGKRLRGYLQYFNGYGESLIDYNHYNNRIGLGVMLTNWL